MKHSTFGEAAHDLERMARSVRMAPIRAARLTAPLIAASIHAEFGHAPPLADLAESTQIDRLRHGYSANEPLKRSGTLEESYVPVVTSGLALLEHGAQGSALALAGSADERAAWHENGYVNARTGHPVPPRPVGRLGLLAVQPMARTIWKNIVARAIGKRN